MQVDVKSTTKSLNTVDQTILQPTKFIFTTSNQYWHELIILSRLFPFSQTIYRHTVCNLLTLSDSCRFKLKEILSLPFTLGHQFSTCDKKKLNKGRIGQTVYKCLLK